MVEGVEEPRALVFPQRMGDEVVVDFVEERDQEQDVLGLLVKAALELGFEVGHYLVAQARLPRRVAIVLDVGDGCGHCHWVALRRSGHALNQLERGIDPVCGEHVGNVRVGEEEVVRSDDEQLSVGEEGGEPAGHGCAGEKHEARVRAGCDDGREGGALSVRDGVVDVVDKDRLVSLDLLGGHCLGDVDRLGVDREDIEAMEHAVGERGLSKAERGIDKGQPRAEPLWPEVLVELEGDLDEHGQSPALDWLSVRFCAGQAMGGPLPLASGRRARASARELMR